VGIAISAVLCVVSTAHATQAPALYRSIAQETLAAFQAGSFDAMQDRFSASFLTQVPMAVMNTIPAGYEGQFGKVQDVVFDAKRDDPSFGSDTLFYWVMTEGSRRAVMRIKLDAEERILLWHIGPAVSTNVSFDDIRRRLTELEGTVSVAVREVGSEAAIFQLQPDESLAVGSTFKLYVLAELLRECDRGKRSLDDLIRLRADLMSGPSGRLQEWPVGAPLTAYSLAAMMISESDNTATDHLIEWIGREHVEQHLADAFLCDSAERNRPFLKTRELFLLQGSGDPWQDYRERYSQAGVSGRRQILAELAKAHPGKMPSVTAAGSTSEWLEWFASANDLVEIMTLLSGDELCKDEALREVAQGILSINPGIPNSPRDDRIAYLGFKGGSEPGVLSLTQLVRMTTGPRFVVAMTWNNPGGETDQTTFVDLLQSLRTATLNALDAAEEP
jgi:hypothetical protein